MSKKDRQATTIGTTAVALHFNGGAVIAANRRGTVSSDTVFYGYGKETEVPMILRMFGTTRAVALAGETGEVLRSIGDNTRDRLVKAEKAGDQLETVKESAKYLCKHFRFDEDKPHVEILVGGWDNMQKEGAPCIWYGNHICPSFVAAQRAIGPGRVFARRILARHRIGMSEEEAIELAEQAIVEVAVGCHQKGGSLDVWVIREGQIIKNQSQLMTHVAEKYGVSI
ncbi:hypothetical protein MKW92_008865 [Papaver armeniacum]|nr:hypothetical protein MKW92_008865 [Papaver armeniacum]